MTSTRRLVVVVAALLLASACGSSDTTTADGATESAPTTAVAAESVPTTADPTAASTPPSTEVAAGTGHHAAGEDEAGTIPEDRPTNAEFNGEDRAELSRQLLAVREVALALPTYGDALAAGYEPTTPYAPGTGAHMGKDADTQPPGAELDIGRPQSLMYAGTEPESPVVGLMYVQLGGDIAPEGFAGPLDTWENPVVGQCLKPDELDPMFPTSDEISQEKCDNAGGRYIDVTAWIQHVWVVPGWEAPGGVFATYNLDIVCADGTTDSTETEGCEPPAGGLG